MALDLAPAPSRAASVRSVVAAGLDVGLAKTVCLAAPFNPDAPPSPKSPLATIGVGVRSACATGTPGDFEACARAIRIALDEAERSVEMAIHKVVASYSGPELSSRIVRGKAKVRARRVAVRDAQAALAAAVHSAPAPGRAALHIAPLGYSVDGAALTSDPRGMRGRVLTVEACIVTAPAAAVEALRQCIRAAGAEPVDVVAAPYAAALAATTEEERAHGVLVIDLGAGGTGLACLCADGLAHVDHLPFGGARMTRDLARRLDATYAAAERAKLLHGVVGGSFDPRDAIEAPRIGQDGRLEAQVVAKRVFAEVLAPRFQEMLFKARTSLKEAELAPRRSPQRVVLVGGGARLAGAREATQDALGLPVRIGHPIGIADLGSARAGPAFATAAGLIRWRLDRPPEASVPQPYEPTLKEVGAATCAAASRAWNWLKENF